MVPVWNRVNDFPVALQGDDHHAGRRGGEGEFSHGSGVDEQAGERRVVDGGAEFAYQYRYANWRPSLHKLA